jgi:glycosyltransferase involved in cell wall biosynthesis
MTTVSVVIPFYNRSKWLWPALDSVLQQTHSDLEILVVDDGSSEELEPERRFYDSRVRFIRQEHAGASAARNRGIRLSRGKYVAFLDADDSFMPNKLQVQVEALEARPDVALIHSSYLRMDEFGNDIEEVHSGTFTGSVYPAIVKECPIATPTVMIRMETLTELGLMFDESVRVGEDVLMWIELARHHEFLGIDMPTTRVRMHGQNAFSSVEAVYEGGMTILRRAFQADPSFGPLERRRAFAQLNANVGYRHRDCGDRAAARRHLIRALAYWPFDPPALVNAVRMSVPLPVARLLRRRRSPAPGARA